VGSGVGSMTVSFLHAVRRKIKNKKGGSEVLEMSMAERVK